MTTLSCSLPSASSHKWCLGLTSAIACCFLQLAHALMTLQSAHPPHSEVSGRNVYLLGWWLFTVLRKAKWRKTVWMEACWQKGWRCLIIWCCQPQSFYTERSLPHIYIYGFPKNMVKLKVPRLRAGLWTLNSGLRWFILIHHDWSGYLFRFFRLIYFKLKYEVYISIYIEGNMKYTFCCRSICGCVKHIFHTSTASGCPFAVVHK